MGSHVVPFISQNLTCLSPTDTNANLLSDVHFGYQFRVLDSGIRLGNSFRVFVSGISFGYQCQLSSFRFGVLGFRGV